LAAGLFAALTLPVIVLVGGTVAMILAFGVLGFLVVFAVLALLVGIAVAVRQGEGKKSGGRR
jgi:uncharacterized membrane protein